jgi:UDP-glucuronate 4-epimerase
MNILITGIAGFIGSNLVEELVNSDNKLIGLDRICNIFIKNQIYSYITYDLSSKKNINDICLDIDVVIHLAGEASLDKNTDVYVKDLRVASENLIHSAIRNKVKKVILLSTIKINSKSDYSKEKLNTEELLKNKTKDTVTKYTIIRSASVYGKGMKSNISNWLWRIKNSNMPSLPISNTQIEMIGINDLCACINKCINEDQTNNKTYTLSDGHVYNINRIESVARDLFGKKSQIFVCPKWLLFLGSRFGDFLGLFHIKFTLNSRIYNFLFHNKVSNEANYYSATDNTPTQNFINEIPNIFDKSKN